MSKRVVFVMMLALLLVMSGVSAQDEPVVIRWFVGLGTGINPDQIPVQEEIVREFNESQDRIILEVQFVETDTAIDALSTLIASGNAPDIVGPVGVEGSNAFADAYLDLEPIIAETGYNLAQFDPQTVDFYRVEGEGLLGLPYAVYPSFLGYNRALFDEADLNYPPENVGDPYILDGEELEWNYDTLARVAQLLTIDANGYDATEPEFDASAVDQYGYQALFMDARALGTTFGAGSFVDADGNAVIPEPWLAAWQWYHDAMFGETPFAPNDAVAQSDAFGNGNVFSSGKVAMSPMHLWYLTCCLGDNVTELGIGVMPSYNGTTTMKLHADNFRILAATQHPLEAFEVMTYLTDTRGLELLQVYGGMPASSEQQPEFLAQFAEGFDESINWDVVVNALSYVDVPSHEGFMPNFNEADTAQNSFNNRLLTEADFDVAANAEALREELQRIFEAAR